MKSHSHLSSAQPSLISQQRKGLTVRASKEQLNTIPSAHLSLPARTRANSDAPMPFERQPLRKLRNPPTNVSDSHTPSRSSTVETILRDGPANHSLTTGLSLLRHTILRSRITAAKDGSSDHRVYIWLALLNVPPLPTDTYLSLIHRGKSTAYEKIQDDVFRTLATDTLFKRRVKEAALTRLLNATAWTLQDVRAKGSEDETLSVYVQGMNVLSAPFLYTARSEAQAYALFSHFVITEVPGYIHPSLAGVHKGLELVDKCLAIVHPTLSSHLLQKGLPAKIYAFASVLTLCACTPPLPEVLHLWDFLFAYGPHLNILCIVAQVLMMKESLLASASPSKLLRSFPALDAQEIIRTTLGIVRKIPNELYAELVVHAR
jgi:cell cycle arrest protein BUB2